VARAAAIGVLAVGVGAVVLLLPHGNLGLRGAGGEATGDLGSCFDPTRYLNAGTLPTPACTVPVSWYLSPAHSLRTYVASATGISPRSPLGSAVGPLEVVLVVVGLAVAVIMLWRFPQEVRPVGLAAWGLMMSLVVMTTLFSRLYHLYIPAWFGIRRLFDYSSLPLIVFALALLEGGLLLLAFTRLPRWLPGLLSAILCVAVAAAVVPSAAAPTAALDRDRALLEPFDWIRANLPCDARILANLHTEGVFEALAGRVAVLEGATPYLVPAVRDPVVRQLLAARDFFHDPAGHSDFLTAQAVGYVAIISTGGIGYSQPIGAVDQPALRRSPFLRPVHAARAMTIYQVVGLPLPTVVPNPGGYGFDCPRGPVAA
jgi:hypothetical protein